MYPKKQKKKKTKKTNIQKRKMIFFSLNLISAVVKAGIGQGPRLNNDAKFRISNSEYRLEFPISNSEFRFRISNFEFRIPNIIWNSEYRI